MLRQSCKNAQAGAEGIGAVFGGGYEGVLVWVMVWKGTSYNDQMHKKRRPKASFFVHLVEPGGFEPPSASPPLSVLHA